MSDAFYVTSDDACMLNGRAYGQIPVVMDDAGQIHEPMTDYLRHLRERGRAESTVIEYAKIFVTFLTLLKCQDRADWKSVGDSLLLQWRNWLADEYRPGHVGGNYINRSLTVLFQFYLWAQQRGYIRDVVGVPSPGRVFPMTAEIREDRYGRGAKMVSPLTIPVVRAPDDRNPTQNEITLLHVALSCHSQEGLNERDTLMAQWAEATLRRLEFGSLLVSELPLRRTAEESLRTNKRCLVTLKTTKGMKTRIMTVDPNLVLDTWRYVEGTRASVVARFKLNGANYTEPKQIFVSTKTGNALVLNSISNIATSAKRKAGIRNGHMHRLRSVGITERIDRIIDHYEATRGEAPSFDAVWLVIQEEAGHAHRSTTERYYRSCLKTREGRAMASAHQVATAEAHLRAIRRQIAREQARLDSLTAKVGG